MEDDRSGRDSCSAAAGPADWYAPPHDPTVGAAAPATPADGHPGLPTSGPTPGWQGPADPAAPGPGMAAPGRHGWARTEGTYTPSVMDKGATKAIVLGVIGLFICGIVLGPSAIGAGIDARRRIQASGGGLTGNGRAIVGMCIGGVATFLSALGLLASVIVATRR